MYLLFGMYRLLHHEMIIRSFKAGDATKAESLRKETILKNIHTFTENFKKEEQDEN